MCDCNNCGGEPQGCPQSTPSNYVLGPHTKGNISSEVVVRDFPMVVRAYNLQAGQKLQIEMLDGLCDYLMVGPLITCGCRATMAVDIATEMTFSKTGRYRFVAVDANGDALPEGEQMPTVVATEQKSGGSGC